GSGKTLAFGVPLLAHIFQHKSSQLPTESSDNDSSSGEEEEEEADEDPDTDKEEEENESGPVAKKQRFTGQDVDLADLNCIEELNPETGEVKSCIPLYDDMHFAGAGPSKNPVTGLIVLPTRELAIQVQDHLRIYARYLSPEVSVLALVGGISIDKQQRLLRKRPDVIVATPGRLWELLRQQNEHLLSMQGNLKCLVIDEADRLLENQHFEELRKILRFIYSTKSTEEVDEMKGTGNPNPEKKPSKIKIDFGNLSKTQKRKMEQRKAAIKSDKPKIQVLVFSATLTFVHKDALQPGGHKRQIKGKPYQHQTKELKLDLLREQIGMSDKCLVVDLSDKMEALVESQMLKSAPNTKPEKKQDKKEKQHGVLGPSSLEEYRLLCQEKPEKDSRLLWLLFCYRNKARALGLPNQRVIVFVNSKANLRRLNGLFRVLDQSGAFSTKDNSVPCVNHLHADMSQKQRLKAVERFQNDDRGILLASDVASRGLDLAGDARSESGVAFVVHFEVPHTAELYIHRRGRAARAGRKGISVLLMEPSDGAKWRKLCQNLDRGEKELPSLNNMAEGKELVDCEAIVEAASKIDITQNRANKQASQTEWFLNAAKEADLELDERDLRQSLSHAVFDDENGGLQQARSKKHKKKNQLDFAKSDLRNLIQVIKTGSSKKRRFIAELHGKEV
ncbi:ATP-dependent RNA helicase ddx24, partial [Cichlidogyrus casuarinus]